MIISEATPRGMAASEAYRLEVYEAHDGGVTLRKLSRTHQISAATAPLTEASLRPLTATL